MKQTLKSFVLIIAMVIACGTMSVKAQSPEYVAAVEKVVELSNVKPTCINQVAGLWAQSGLRFTIPTEKVATIAIDAVWDDMMHDMAMAYSRYFTLDELKALASFYQSPLGAKVAKHQSDISEVMQAAGAKYGQKMAGAIMQYIKQ